MKLKNILYTTLPFILSGYLANYFNIIEINIEKKYIAINYNNIFKSSSNIDNKEDIQQNIKPQNNNYKTIELTYPHYSLIFNCDMGGYDYFEYYTVPDQEINLKRYSPFHKDINAINKCGYSGDRLNSASNTSTYKNPTGYDRGHGVHQNIWDHDKQLMKETNYMSNIVPHESEQNRRGLWRELEKLTECQRDYQQLYVIGGNVWGNDSSNDYFVKTHNVYTPDYLFKIIKFENGDTYTWLFPNDNKANIKNANNYLTSVSKIEELTGYSFDNIIEKKVIQKETPSIKTISKKCDLE